MTVLPTRLYTAAAVAQLERAAFEQFHISGYTLMRRAGQAVLDCLLDAFPAARKIIVYCGAGNNAGDGYVVARLAHKHGLQVIVASLIDVTQIKGDARLALQHWLEVGSVIAADQVNAKDADVIIDAILGTGLTRALDDAWCNVVEHINAANTPVIAVDLPSGLHADTGVIQGAAIRADATVCFIGLKRGLFTAQARDCCGELVFDDLGMIDDVCTQVSAAAMLLDHDNCALPVRSHASHKGSYGHVLVVGGNYSMSGAVMLAATAALRLGAGKVSVVTRTQHAASVVTYCPELMVHASDTGELDPQLLHTIDCIAIGPGLGRDGWAQRLLKQCLAAGIALVLDADALHLIAAWRYVLPITSVITPHPGEAAQLLQTTTVAIQQDRFSAVSALQQRYGAITVLKGSGTLIADAQHCYVCAAGNPAMASAGMGDVLTGMIAALRVQGLSPVDAANIAVFQHAQAADRLAAQGRRVVLASDVIAELGVA